PAVEAEKVATADPDPQERPAGEDEGEAVIEAKSRADVHAALGKTVRVVGRPENSKASPLLLLDSGESVYCRLGGSHWPDAVSGQRIAVTGEVVLLPGPIFPTATRDEDGAWSQGVEAQEAAAGQAPEGGAGADPPRDFIIQVVSQVPVE
ncbi:MAG: hypothetical protein VX498_06625, partial [Myxococcota bacterium]|nr:hypothetical protein [Myxococcota bacterium]